MITRSSFMVNGKEVKNPVLRVLWLVLALAIVVIILAPIFVFLTATFWIIIGSVVLTALLVVIPHFILRIFGRQGFFKRTHDEATNETSFKMDVSGAAFRKTREF